MNYEQFEHYVLLLQSELIKESEINHFLQKMNLLESGFWLNLTDGKLIDAYIDILSIAMEDDNDWIAWFVFDNDFGKKGLKAGYKNKMKKIVTIKQLYNLIKNKS